MHMKSQICRHRRKDEKTQTQRGRDKNVDGDIEAS